MLPKSSSWITTPGKTSLAANLAAAMAENGTRTILVNTDFRRPRLASVLGPGATVPLPFTLDDLDRLDARSLLNKTDHENLLLFDLTSMEGSPGEMLRATLFTDWGVLDPDAFQVDPREVRGTVGFGFGLSFPIPLTLNFGFPVVYQEVDRRQVFSFSIALF